jgi:hypothetical protein
MSLRAVPGIYIWQVSLVVVVVLVVWIVVVVVVVVAVVVLVLVVVVVVHRPWPKIFSPKMVNGMTMNQQLKEVQ